MLTEHCFNTGIVTLNYAEGASSGPPLVLLHGGSARWQSVLPLLPELSQHWHIYAQTCEGMENPGLFLVDTVCWIILLILKRSSSKLSRSLRSSSDILWEVILRSW